ncbi:hypothetical protein T484DRAFT_1918885, partial [Baffinella frigidus]
MAAPNVRGFFRKPVLSDDWLPVQPTRDEQSIRSPAWAPGPVLRASGQQLLDDWFLLLESADRQAQNLAQLPQASVEIILRVPSTASGYEPGPEEGGGVRAARRLTPLESDFSEDPPSRKPDIAWRDSHDTALETRVPTRQTPLPFGERSLLFENEGRCFQGENTPSVFVVRARREDSFEHDLEEPTLPDFTEDNYSDSS